MERIRKQNWNTYKRLMAFADEWDQLRILHALVEHRTGTGYDTIQEYAEIPRRTVRHKVKSLADMNVVQREGNPALVSFVDEEREFLAVDAAAFAVEV